MREGNTGNQCVQGVITTVYLPEERFLLPPLLVLVWSIGFKLQGLEDAKMESLEYMACSCDVSLRCVARGTRAHAWGSASMDWTVPREDASDKPGIFVQSMSCETSLYIENYGTAFAGHKYRKLSCLLKESAF